MAGDKVVLMFLYAAWRYGNGSGVEAKNCDGRGQKMWESVGVSLHFVISEMKMSLCFSWQVVTQHILFLLWVILSITI